MGQREVYEALVQLGGRASRDDIRDEFNRLHPDSDRSHFSMMLLRLRGRGYVSFDPKTEEYFTASDFPAPNVTMVRVR